METTGNMIPLLCALIGGAGVLYSIWLAASVKRAPAGNERMQEIASAIREGAVAYLHRQLKSAGLTGVIIAILAAMVLLGGIKRIASVAGKLVPVMALAYLFAGLVILAMNFDTIPHAFSLIFTHAFTPVAATGGFAGAAVWAAIRSQWPPIANAPSKPPGVYGRYPRRPAG